MTCGVRLSFGDQFTECQLYPVQRRYALAYANVLEKVYSLVRETAFELYQPGATENDGSFYSGGRLGIVGPEKSLEF